MMRSKILITCIFLFSLLSAKAQYTKEKLTDVLTGGSTKSWTVKGVNSSPDEKSFSFNKNMTAVIVTQAGKSTSGSWSLNSTDNIRWFLLAGGKTYEIIVSYDKAGKQFVKLTLGNSNDKSQGYTELQLYPANKSCEQT